MGKIYDEASKVGAEEGVVYVDGPDGVSVALTPEAAIATSDELLEQGAKAHGQNVQAERDKKERQDRAAAKRQGD